VWAKRPVYLAGGKGGWGAALSVLGLLTRKAGRVFTMLSSIRKAGGGWHRAGAVVGRRQGDDPTFERHVVMSIA